MEISSNPGPIKADSSEVSGLNIEQPDPEISQIENGPKIQELANKLAVKDADDLIKVRDALDAALEDRPYDKSVAEQEQSIRWRRTAEQILEDGYVYQSKSCTDRIIVFLALCKQLGIDGSFVKVMRGKSVHSIAEVKINDEWYVFDASTRTSVPVKGQVTEEHPYNNWKLWKKGRDAWDLELVDFKAIDKIR